MKPVGIKEVVAVAAASVLLVPTVSGTVVPLHRRQVSGQTNPSAITATSFAANFDVEVQFGNQSFFLLVDTGSSDTWVAADGFRCINATDNLELPQSACAYGPTYNISATFSKIQNETFDVQYGAGIAVGFLGTEQVTVGGITVSNQTVGIVQSATNAGDSVNSGILGLGYPSLTSAHPGNNYPNDSVSLITNRNVYDPVFTSMYKQGLTSSWYSVALDRLQANVSTGPGGYLGFGVLPNVSYTNNWATAPVEITGAIPDAYYANGTPTITLWTLTVNSVAWGPPSLSTNTTTRVTGSNAHDSPSGTTTNGTSFQAAVDTGNAFNLLPLEVATAVNGLFDPPAVLDTDSGVFVVDCAARAPQLGITIGNQTFWHSAEDLIINASDQNGGNTTVCVSAVSTPADTDSIGLNFLGDAFLKNVVAVFDIGKNEMRFAARVDNSSMSSGNGTASTSAATVSLPVGIVATWCALLVQVAVFLL